MIIEQILSSKSVLFCIAVAVVLSVVLTFFPLIGALGFEFAALNAVILSFLSVFISSALISSSETGTRGNKGLSNIIGSIFFINLLLLVIVFIIGLISSLIKGDCFIKEGSIFFLLIPEVSVFFSASIGMLSGYIFGRMGIILGLIVVFLIALYGLVKLYYGISIFVFNPIFGFFPGPLYDEAIPITLTLVTSRVFVLLIGALLLFILRLIVGLKRSSISVWDPIVILVLAASIILIKVNEPNIGISYTRSYITENILSDSIETENFIIYFAPGTEETINIELIGSDHEWRYEQLKEYLAIGSSEKIKSYIYPDVETRKKLIGAGDTTIANPIHGEIHLIYETFPHPILKHELVHVMSGEFGNDVLKISPKIGLLEGIAVASDWRGQRYTPHQWSKAIVDMGIAPEISEIVGIGFWYSPSEISYTMMGSFSRYLIDTYGIGDYKKAYKTGDFSVYGKSLDDLEGEWLEYLNTVDTPPETKAIAEARFSRPSIFQATCPRKIAELKNSARKEFLDDNYTTAREQLSEALAYNSSDTGLIKWLAYSHYYSGNYQRAMEIAGSTAESTKIEKNILENIKANSLWQSGNSELALKKFESLREEDLTDNLAREIDIKISAITEGSTIEEYIKQFFATRDNLLQLSYLHEVTSENPSYAPAYYLKGRLFFNEGEYDKATPNFMNANIMGLNDERIRNENLRILGISQFAQGNYDQAAVTFNYLLLFEENQAARAFAQDFIERIAWMRDNENSLN